ncbi:hypothetical protein OCJ37_00260 [Xanthomonas sp. AM6]|nr:hypothetical protein OCJ37_00260 [Xanthomonas sp. AM6]
MDRLFFSSLWMSLAPNTIIVAVQLGIVTWITTANGSGARGPGFGAIGKRTRTPTTRSGSDEALLRGRDARARSATTMVAVVIAGLPVVMATFGIQTARMCECRCWGEQDNQGGGDEDRSVHVVSNFRNQVQKMNLFFISIY